MIGALLLRPRLQLAHGGLSDFDDVFAAIGLGFGKRATRCERAGLGEKAVGLGQFDARLFEFAVHAFEFELGEFGVQIH